MGPYEGILDRTSRNSPAALMREFVDLRGGLIRVATGRRDHLMQIEIDDAAVDWVVQRGGTAAIDFIRPVG